MLGATCAGGRQSRKTMDVTDLDALKAFGTDAVSFQAVKAGARWWRDAPPPEGTGAAIAYVSCGQSWIAIGSPLADAASKSAAVRRFAVAARANRRRVVFFGVEDLQPFDGYRSLLVGLQSVLKASEWHATLRQRPRLREQLRRARAKGVTVRSVDAAALADGMPLRASVERLRREWLGSRAMEPMAFLVSVEPFHVPAEHLYFIAERHGTAVQFLSAVPIYARSGWLMEDMLRGANAPNGATELVIDALMRRLEGDSLWLTPGLTPLAGPIPWWLRMTRFIARPLYDFSGLWRFRSRLRPSRWQPIWIAWDRGPAIGVILDVLGAFAGGQTIRFACRSLVRHPNGPPWTVALPLVPWTVLLGVLSSTGRADVLGFSTAALTAWTVFDAVLAWLLFAVARKPRRRGLAMMAVAAGFDAIVSVRHLAVAGFGSTVASGALRAIATAGPIIGTIALGWALWRAHLAHKPRLPA